MAVWFLAWMDASGLTVGDLDQHTLDRYVARVKTRGPVENFVQSSDSITRPVHDHGLHPVTPHRDWHPSTYVPAKHG